MLNTSFIKFMLLKLNNIPLVKFIYRCTTTSHKRAPTSITYKYFQFQSLRLRKELPCY